MSKTITAAAAFAFLLAVASVSPAHAALTANGIVENVSVESGAATATSSLTILMLELPSTAR